MLDNRFVLTDVESFGLVVEEDPILEVGFGIYDLDFQLIDNYQSVVWESGLYDDRLERMRFQAKMNPNSSAAFVLNMHTSSGLLDEAIKHGSTMEDVERDADHWLEAHGVKNPEPMVGSSVGFDKAVFEYNMPAVARRFGYRVVDISSFKLVWSAKYPEVAAGLPAVWPARKTHRVLEDIEDSMRELEFYVDSIEGVKIP